MRSQRTGDVNRLGHPLQATPRKTHAGVIAKAATLARKSSKQPRDSNEP